jgi:hypothetical protein
MTRRSTVSGEFPAFVGLSAASLILKNFSQAISIRCQRAHGERANRGNAWGNTQGKRQDRGRTMPGSGMQPSHYILGKIPFKVAKRLSLRAYQASRSRFRDLYATWRREVQFRASLGHLCVCGRADHRYVVLANGRFPAARRVDALI